MVSNRIQSRRGKNKKKKKQGWAGGEREKYTGFSRNPIREPNLVSQYETGLCPIIYSLPTKYRPLVQCRNCRCTKCQLLSNRPATR